MKFTAFWKACATALGVDPEALKSVDYLRWIAGRRDAFQAHHGRPQHHPLPEKEWREWVLGGAGG